MDSLAPELDPSDYLSARQKQVLICAAAGLTNLQISERLFVSRRSVDRDVREACEALSVPTRTAAVLQAYRVGVVKDEHLVELDEKPIGHCPAGDVGVFASMPVSNRQHS